MSKNIMIFPGQGSQSIGMGKDFYTNDPLAKKMIDDASNRLDIDFTHLLFEPNEDLEQTQFTQPAILLISLVSYRLFEREVHKKPLYALGHSLGEFSALASVGALDFLDALELVHKRGAFMQKACANIDAGMMALLGLSDEKTHEIITAQQKLGKQVWAANYNCDGQIVIAGAKKDLLTLEDTFKQAGAKRALVLNMSVASHCPLLQSVQEPLMEYLEQYLRNSFQAPVISNVSAKAYDSKKEALELLANQLVMPVKYKQSILSVDDEADRFIEFGGKVLQGLNKRLAKKPTLSIVDMASLEQVLLSL
ncbi:MAG: ACP S-malonyltransferase [Sulfurospirillum sp.]|nr:ACP S-malonyltransferase [Sulfurospirillum sp.]